MKKILYLLLCLMFLSQNFLSVPIIHAGSYTKAPAKDGIWDAGGYWMDEPENFVGFSGDAEYGVEKSAIQFNLTDINEAVSKATLRFYVTEIQDLNLADSAVPIVKVYGSSINSWGASFPKNPGDPLLNPTDTGVTKGQWKELEVTGFVQTRMSADKVVTFALVGEEVVPGVQFMFASDNFPFTSLRPQLVLSTGTVDITSVTSPSAKTGLPNGTAKNATALGLPSQVEVTLSDSSKTNVDVSWDVVSTTYNPATKTAQTFTVTGTLTNLPSNVTNTTNKTASISVTVDAEPTKDILSVKNPTAITGLANGTTKTVAALGLPAEVEVTLDDSSKINVDVSWDVASTTYNPATKTAQTFTVTGTLTNLPSNVTNTTNKTASISVTVDAEVVATKDITAVASLPAKTGLANGTTKTVAALGLPAEVEVTLDDSSKINVDVNWDVASTTYNPATKTAQTFTIAGTLTNLPSNVTNTTNKTASISVTVDAEVVATKDITAVASLPAITGLANGTTKTVAALGVPAQVEVTLDDSSKINVDVNWDVASTTYNPATKTAQTFTVTGTLTNLPSNVTNTTNKTASISVTVDAEPAKDILSVKNPTAITGLANGTTKTVAALGLPAEVEVTLNDSSKINVDVNWDVASTTYNPATKTAQTFTIAGTLTNLPSNVTNTTNKTASISVTVDAEVVATKDITAVASLPAITGLANGTTKTVAALGLPAEVEVTLNDSSKINVDVNWDVASTTYNPATKTAQTFTVTGTLTNLPSNVTNTTNKTASISVTVDAEVVATKDITAVASLPAITGLANGTTKTVAALGVPAQVEVTLDDSSKINVDVNWDVASTTYNPATKTAQTFTVTGTLTNLPSNVTNTTNKTASISVTVDAEPAKDILSVKNPTAITGLANGTTKTVAALGVPAQVEVTLDDSSKINVDVSWDVASTTYNPATKTAQTFTVTGTLTNLPSNVTNTTNKTASISVTVDAEAATTKDITAVASLPAITGLANGTSKTAAALGLPTEVEVTLNDSSKINVDISWGVASTTYDPTKKTVQTFTVEGTLTPLPSNVTNTTGKTASISVTVDAEAATTKDITAVASLPAITGLANGTSKTAAALGLPTEVEVTLNDSSKISVDISWDVASTTYDPTKKTAQTFTVEGTLTPLPSNVTNTTGKTASISVTVDAEAATTKDITAVASLPAITGLANGTSKTAAALGLPTEVEVTLNDSSKISVDISWDVASTTYDPTKKTAQTFTVEGTLTPLPSNVTNTTGKTASISVTVDAEAVTTKDITAVASLPAITGLANGTAKTASALGLPAQVKVSLSDNSKINVDVNWDVASTIYNPATKTAQTFTVIGTPVNLPNGITNSQNRTASIQVSVKAADVIEVPKYIVEVINPSAIKDVANGTKKTASALGLPTQVEVTLSDNSRINVDVSWDVADSSYDPGNKEEQKFTVTGTLVNLPNGVNNSQGLTASIRITVNAADVVEVPKDIVEVINPSAIKDVANGTKKTAAALGLPEVVSVKLDDGSTIEVEVSWDVADSSYDPSTEEEQTFTVTGELVNLLKGVTNSQNLEASIRVTVEGADVVGQPRNIVEVFDPSAIKDVANGTKKTASALGLPEKVKVKLDDGTTIKVEVSWDVADSSYDPDNKKEQRFTVKGTLVNLPDGIENSKELNVTIRVVVDAAPKRDNDRGKDRDERPNTNDSSTPKETARFVIVEAGNDRSLMEQVEIIRKMSADNKQVDEVVLNKNKANDILKKVAKNKEDAIRIVIDDLPKDAADEVSVKVAKAALGLIKEQNVSIEIKTNDVTITISKEMVGTLGNELYFRIVPIKKPEEEQSVSKRTINEVKRVAGGQDIQIVSKPMMIETNYSNLRTKVMFPLDDVNLPTELTAQRAFLSSLAVYVDHMDGTNELKNGEIQYDQNGKPIGIEIEIDKFSTFTILSLKGKQEVVHHQSYMMGYSDLTFKPNSALTRAELASILVHFLNAVDTQQAGEVETSFADVHANHWAAKSIQQVRNAGLMMGDGNGLFHPNAKITRAEMAVIISKWKKLTIPGKGTVFFDIKGHWAEESIMAVAESGTMKGYDERSFRPNQGLTRAEAVTLFNRLTNRGPISGVTVEIWTDVPRSHWAFAEIAEATMPHTATKQVDGTEFVSD